MQVQKIVRRLWRPGYIAIMIAVVIAVGSLMPADDARALPGNGFLKHALPYALLSFFTILAVRGKVNAGLVLLSVLGYGAMLEVIQPVFGRTFDTVDLIANAAGGLLGLGAILPFERIIGRLPYNLPLGGNDQA